MPARRWLRVLVKAAWRRPEPGLCHQLLVPCAGRVPAQGKPVRFVSGSKLADSVARRKLGGSMIRGSVPGLA